MAYELNKASNAQTINEQEFFTGKEITFPNLDSCIGVIAKNGDTLTGVHLVMCDKNDEMFNSEAALAVLEKLPEADSFKLISPLLDVWQYSLSDGFNTLVNGLEERLRNNNVGIELEMLGETGNYKAKVEGYGIEVEKSTLSNSLEQFSQPSISRTSRQSSQEQQLGQSNTSKSSRQSRGI